MVSGAFILPCPLLLRPFPAPPPTAPTPPRPNIGDQFTLPAGDPLPSDRTTSHIQALQAQVGAA